MQVRSVAARLVAVVGMVLATLAAGLVGSASACACGVYITNADTAITGERAALKWDGTTEDLVVSLDVMGSSPDAAWLMPLPAQAEVTLADIDLFTELADRTAPVEEKVTNWWPNFGYLEMLGITGDDGATSAGSAAVEVLTEQQLGPLTVAQLAANDPAALGTWLTDNGYQLDEAVSAAAQPYAQAGWIFVAARVTAPDPAAPLQPGTLQPIRMVFPSTEPVYPMRLSQAATRAQDVSVYVLAANRMQPEFTAVPGVAPELVYAGWLDPGEIGPVSAVGQWLTQRSFLVRYDQVIENPAAITGDYTFAQAPEDEEFQSIVFVDRDLGWLTGGLLTVLGLVLLAVVPTRIVYKRRLRAEYEGRA